MQMLSGDVKTLAAHCDDILILFSLDFILVIQQQMVQMLAGDANKYICIYIYI